MGTENRITINPDGTLNVPDKPRIPFIEGDGIGPEIVTEAVRVMQTLQTEYGFEAELVESPVGGAGYDAHGKPLPDETLALARIFRAECLIYNGTPGCRNTWGMVKPFARETEAAGFPTHIMYTDAFDDRVESWEATAERLDEFFKVRGLLRC